MHRVQYNMKKRGKTIKRKYIVHIQRKNIRVYVRREIDR